jgi:hypothetical protein
MDLFDMGLTGPHAKETPGKYHDKAAKDRYDEPFAGALAKP